MDEIAPRKIKIGKATVGLIGLDVALNQSLKKNMNEQEALAEIFARISRYNYIPPGMEEEYRAALLREFRRLKQGETRHSGELTIRILGQDCISCNRLNTMVFDIMGRMGLAADIEQIHDPDEIWRRGIFATPALIINGRIKCSGRMPAPAEVETWLSEAAQ